MRWGRWLNQLQPRLGTLCSRYFRRERTYFSWGFPPAFSNFAKWMHFYQFCFFLADAAFEGRLHLSLFDSSTVKLGISEALHLWAFNVFVDYPHFLRQVVHDYGEANAIWLDFIMLPTTRRFLLAPDWPVKAFDFIVFCFADSLSASSST
jgi:hypothetical protein